MCSINPIINPNPMSGNIKHIYRHDEFLLF
jgi:hypothetical protein